MEEQHEPLTLAAVADVLKVGVPTVEGLIERGLLVAEGEGDAARVAYSDLVEYLRTNQRASTSEGEAPADGLAGDLGGL